MKNNVKNLCRLYYKTFTYYFYIIYYKRYVAYDFDKNQNFEKIQ